MLEISPHTYTQLRNTLLKCSQFASTAELKALFVDARLSPWRNELPEANQLAARVNLAIDFLADQYTKDQQNALVLLMYVLMDQFDTEDARYNALRNLANELDNVLAMDATSPIYGGEVYLSPSKREHLDEERREIRELLILFERAAFSVEEGYYSYGDPTVVFNAIRETRIELNKRGAAYITDVEIADVFAQIRDTLFQLERDIGKQYPKLVELATEWRNRPTGGEERITTIKNALGEKAFAESAYQIRLVASTANAMAEDIRAKLRAMNEQLKA